MSTFQLNEDQKQAVKAISRFIISDKKEFFLTGGPGVGKTFTTKELVNVLPTILDNYNKAMNKNSNSKFLYLTSTTNKAAAVLSDQTGRDAHTIHSFLGVKPKNDFDTGRTYLIKTNKWKVHRDCIIFIDEASMIEKNLYTLINEATDNSCKIIYIGDKDQLPPVMEKLSPAVKLSSIDKQSYEIKTPVRNAGSPALIDLCNRLREDIVNEKSENNLTHWKSVPDQIIHLNGDELKEFINSTYGVNGSIKETDDELACKILAYTNSTVIGYNEYIRKVRSLSELPTKGEVMVCNRHYSLTSNLALNAEENIKILEINELVENVIDPHNTIMSRKLTISSNLKGIHKVHIPVDQNQLKQLSNHYKRAKDWKKFYSLQEHFIDLRNREAATVYKAQGSTYDSVIMIMDDIFSSRDINQLRRMLYVGASRARNKIYVYDKGIHSNDRGIY